MTHFGDPNPYASLPTMNIYTYDLGRLLHEFVDEDVAFNFREFFRVNEAGNFIHEKDVKAFLNLISKEDKDSCYPFANEEYRNIFRHTLWMLPGVKEARAMSALLQSHPVFQHFKVVNVAGDGDEDEESKDALAAVEEAIGKDPDATRTITLSCGRLTTGVSARRGRVCSCCLALIIQPHQVICRPSSVCRHLPPSMDESRNSVMCLTLRRTEH